MNRSQQVKPTRRSFLAISASVSAQAAVAAQVSEPPPQRITVAQVAVSRSVEQNLDTARRVFAQAAKDRAGWVHFPEGFLSGYYTGFRQEEVSASFTEVQRLCRDHGVIGLIGTCWNESGKLYNQIRIVDVHGGLVGSWTKTHLTTGELRSGYTPGGLPLTFECGGIRFGLLICNDLWRTPGYSGEGPFYNLSLKQARAGAQVIFHSVNSGNDLRYRPYHESNLMTYAAEAKCPIVVANAFSPPEPNARSGVIGTGFEYLAELPPDREAIRTVEFRPAPARDSDSNDSRARVR
jgi:predicted amidohydrolase